MKFLVLLLCTVALHITDTSAADVDSDKHSSINDNNVVQEALDFSGDEDVHGDVIEPYNQEINCLTEDEDNLVIPDNTETSAEDNVGFDKHSSINDNNVVQEALDVSGDEDVNGDVIEPYNQEINCLTEDEDDLVIPDNTETSAEDNVGFDKHSSIIDDSDWLANLDISGNNDDNSDVIDPDKFDIQLRHSALQETNDNLENEDKVISDIADTDAVNDGGFDKDSSIEDDTQSRHLKPQELFDLLEAQNNLITSELVAPDAPVIDIARMRAARNLLEGSGFPQESWSGTRVTWQYKRRGNFDTAKGDFDNFMPDNVRPINGRIRGRTGTFGDHHYITVRDGSSSGAPTLEFRSPVSNPEAFGRPTSTMVRKFRYTKDRSEL